MLWECRVARLDYISWEVVWSLDLRPVRAGVWQVICWSCEELNLLVLMEAAVGGGFGDLGFGEVWD